MGFLVPCPNCGQRDVYEFRFGGEKKDEPGPAAGLKEWRHHIHFNRNLAGVQQEWWYHHACDEWLLVERDTTTNQIFSTKRMSEPRGAS
jgi:sarcosine oxidase subunit delta